MKIEKIRKLKNGKYKLEFDNKEKIITYDNVILSNNLLLKKDLSNDFINKLDMETKYYDIYQKCFRYISIKMRSKKEIINYLKKQQIDTTEQEKIIQDLVKNNLINDDEYLVAFISDKINLSIIGPNKIKKELLEHDIDSNKIDLELSKYENIWSERIKKIIEKKMLSNHNSFIVFEQKCLQELINIGYDRDIIITELNQLSFDDSLQFEQTADKLFLKLSKKYSGYELKNKLKSKLYQKGYSIEKINYYIQKRID